MEVKHKKGKPLFKNSELNSFFDKCIDKTLSLNKGEFKKEIFNDELFLILLNSELKVSNESIFESHKEFYDIHYIIEGNEKIELLELKDSYIPYESSRENDYYLYENSIFEKEVVLNKNEFIIFPFEIIHKVGIETNTLDKTVSKIVIKIKKALFNKEFIDE